MSDDKKADLFDKVIDIGEYLEGAFDHFYLHTNKISALTYKGKTNIVLYVGNEKLVLQTSPDNLEPLANFILKKMANQ